MPGGRLFQLTLLPGEPVSDSRPQGRLPRIEYPGLRAAWVLKPQMAFNHIGGDFRPHQARQIGFHLVSQAP